MKISQLQQEFSATRYMNDAEWTIFCSIPAIQRKLEKVGAEVVRRYDEGADYKLPVNQLSFRTAKSGKGVNEGEVFEKGSFNDQEIHIQRLASEDGYYLFTNSPTLVKKLKGLGAKVKRVLTFGVEFQLEIGQVSFRSGHVEGENEDLQETAVLA